jgi:glycosyltransferase involved in cell wall biosynthesis
MELVIPGECVSEHVGIAEVIFVDDSTDDTRRLIEQVAAHSTVSLLRRRPRERTGGLSGAVADGILAAFTDDRWFREAVAATVAEQACDANLEPAPAQLSTKP